MLGLGVLIVDVYYSWLLRLGFAGFVCFVVLAGVLVVS